MTETTETTETAETAEIDLPPLAKAITIQLTDLAAHACVHGQHDGSAGRDTPEEMPPCLADHVASLSTTLFGLTKPEEHASTITTTVELPLENADLPEGLVERVQKAVGDLAEALVKKS